MATLHDLNTVARRLILELREGVERLERTEGSTAMAPSLSRDLHHKLSELQKISTTMQQQFRILVLKESSAKRDAWKRKVDAIADEAIALKHSLDKVDRRDSRRKTEEQSRNELFHRTTDGGDLARELAEGFDAEAQMFASAGRSGHMLDEILDSGARVLKAMHGQRETMKSAHRKVLDVLNSTGLSDSLLRVADRRQRTDATLVYGGMLAVVALTFLAWRWSMRRAHGGGGGGGGGINDGQHGGGYHLMGGGGLGAAEHHFAAGSGS